YWFIRLVNADGEIEFTSPEAPELEKGEPVSPRLLDLDGIRYRIVQAPLNLEGLPPMQLQIGASVSAAEDDIVLLTRMIVLIGGLILILAPLGGFWLAGRATAPIAEIIRATGQLRPSHLDERLPLRQAGDELDQLSQTINGLLDRLASFVRE